MKLIGLDVGTKRIGVARADTTTRIAVPEGYIVVDGQEFSDIAHLAKVHQTNIFVLGLPRSNSGNETKQSAYVRKFAKRLYSTIPGAKIYFQDESLTSVEAENRLKARKRPYDKGEIDAESAAIILQDFIERMASMSSVAKNPKLTAPSVKQPTQSPKPTPQTTTPTSTTKGSHISKTKSKPTPTTSRAEHSTPATSRVEHPASQAKPRHFRAGKVIAILVLVIVIIAGLTAAGGWIWYNSAIEPVVSDIECRYSTSEEQNAAEASVPEACSFIRFSVEPNQSVSQISQNLENAGLIKSALAFQILVHLEGKAPALQAGDYEFRPVMSSNAILEALSSGRISANTFNFTIIPGETLADIKGRLATNGYTEAEISAALEKAYDHQVLKGLYHESGDLSSPDQPRTVQLEGYLYPETYQFYKNESVENIILRTLDELNTVIKSNDLEEKFQAQGLTLREGIILASIIQKEAETPDMPGVAQVFLNRLAQGTMLGSDVTATYAANLTDPNRTTLTDNAAVLGNDSPYNTRRTAGLPPGPISVPSLSALLAVANPDASHQADLFFLTGDDGMMYYSSTEQGHLDNVQNHCQKLCNAAL